jgi:hypothetical protein
MQRGFREVNMATVSLPRPDGTVELLRLGPPSPYPRQVSAPFPRVVYAAAHVVADPLGMARPWSEAAVDWEATLAFRRHLYGLGFRVAEAMDTSQRGMGLDWAGARELISRSTAEARGIDGAALACGAGTDQLDPAAARGLDDVIRAYEEQMAHVEACGGRVILMASRALCRVARGPEDYLAVYDHLIGRAKEPVILHWLGAMFDPALAGYWGSTDVETAMGTVLALIRNRADRIEGIKISLLEASHEITMRRLLPARVMMFTGDDFNYAELMAGDATHHSHGLLGIFAAIAPAAAAALQRLGAGDVAGYHAVLAPTVPLSRCIFEAPTPFYKAGIVFLAWLNGFQPHFRMLGGMESARGALHYAQVLRLADRAGLLRDPDGAARRARAFFATQGVS